MPPLSSTPYTTNLLKLKAPQLKLLAQCTGLKTTGNKDKLASSILGSLRDLKPRELGHNGGKTEEETFPKDSSTTKEGRRILSIDMGVKNLAYCLLDVPDLASLQTNGDDKIWLPPRHRSTSVAGPGVISPYSTLATVRSWSRLSTASLAQEAPATPPSPDSAPPATGQDKNHISNSDLKSNLNSDLFSLPSLSAAANALIRHLVLSPTIDKKPDTVLIETQRWRSGSGAAIQQWTVRVNVFEAMLWAALGAAIGREEWIGNVEGVDPGSVGRWWLGNDSGTKKAKEGKREKVVLVRRWLEKGEVVSFGGEGKSTEVDGIRRAFVAAGAGRKKVGGRKRKGKGYEGQAVEGNAGVAAHVIEKDKDSSPEKWDDLADCLLQGVAWVQWERNKRILLERGLDAIIEEVK